MAKFVGLITAIILAVLASQSEPITATIGYAWSALHFIAVVKSWYDTSA